MANTPNKVFADANLLIEIIHDRKKQAEVINFTREHAGAVTISPLTVHLVMYFGKKIASQQALEQLLSDFTVLPLTAAHVQWAFAHARDNDFEDALQLACAVLGDCTHFATLDGRLAKRYASLGDIKIQLL